MIHDYDQVADQQGGQGADPEPKPDLGFQFFDVIDEGEEIPAWHGAWRMNGMTNQLHTAVVPLNLLMRLYWRAVVFVKMGGSVVAGDPRQAFMDGYEAGVKDHPGNLQDWQASLEAREQAINDYATSLAQREGLLSQKIKQLRDATAPKNGDGSAPPAA